jgi:hypothetical protein
MIGLTSLTRFATPGGELRSDTGCELCGAPIGDAHRHGIERGERGAMCACQSCAILFGRPDAAGRFRTVPDRVIADRSFAISAERWAGLGIPVALAFCYRDSLRGRGVVCYPGPAGVTDAELDAGAWEAIAAATHLAGELADDVEALLVRGGRGGGPLACYLVPITAAFELAGRLRGAWSGFSGGAAAEAVLASTFAELDRRGGRR